jgi:hypothetical protein
MILIDMTDKGRPYPSSQSVVIYLTRFYFEVLAAGLESHLVGRVEVEVRQLISDSQLANHSEESAKIQGQKDSADASQKAQDTGTVIV